MDSLNTCKALTYHNIRCDKVLVNTDHCDLHSRKFKQQLKEIEDLKNCPEIEEVYSNGITDKTKLLTTFSRIEKIIRLQIDYRRFAFADNFLSQNYDINICVDMIYLHKIYVILKNNENLKIRMLQLIFYFRKEKVHDDIIKFIEESEKYETEYNRVRQQVDNEINERVNEDWQYQNLDKDLVIEEIINFLNCLANCILNEDQKDGSFVCVQNKTDRKIDPPSSYSLGIIQHLLFENRLKFWRSYHNILQLTDQYSALFTTLLYQKGGNYYLMFLAKDKNGKIIYEDKLNSLNKLAKLNGKFVRNTKTTYQYISLRIAK